MGIPFFVHLGVDDDPSFGIGATRIADTQLSTRRRGSAVGGDHIGGPHPLERVGAKVGQHQFDVVRFGQHAQTFVFEQHVDVAEPIHPFAEDMVDRRLIEKLLGRVARNPWGRSWSR